MEARVPRCTHAATSVPCHVTCCDAQTISEASKHQALREWPSLSCYARTSEIYLYGGICKKPRDGNAGRIPPVGPLCQTAERRWSKGRQVYGRVRLLEQFWLDDRSGNAVELALELDRIAGPDRLEHRHELVRPRSALAQAHSHSVKLVLGPAQAHADSQAAVRQDVQRGKTTGQHHGVVVEHVNHTRPQPHPRGMCGGERQRLQRIEAVLVGLGQRAVRRPLIGRLWLDGIKESFDRSQAVVA